MGTYKKTLISFLTCKQTTNISHYKRDNDNYEAINSSFRNYPSYYSRASANGIITNWNYFVIESGKNTVNASLIWVIIVNYVYAYRLILRNGKNFILVWNSLTKLFIFRDILVFASYSSLIGSTLRYHSFTKPITSSSLSNKNSNSIK